MFYIRVENIPFSVLSKLDIKDRYQVEELFRKEKFTHVVNLAAQAGVQYSIQNPHSYIENNITGFINLIDAAKTHGCSTLCVCFKFQCLW
jgi:UDP-glucuronate 4-epimerase